MLLTELLDGLHQRLTSFNRRKLRAEQVRVGLAIHGGEVLRDPDPLEGAATILTCRLLDADMLRACLRVTSQPLAAIASRAIWEGIIRHDYPGIAATSWHVVTVQTKEGLGPAWVHVPGDPAAPERARQFVDEAADVKGKASRRTAS